MAKSKSEVVAFNAGEFGKEALARVDLQNYPRGAEIMENLFPLRQGGMTKMAGTEYIGGTPDDDPAWLRPFVFSAGQAFALEVSDELVRLIYNGSYVQVTGAVATVGSWADESGTTSTGGGSAPSGGTSGPPGSGGGGVDPGYDGSYTGEPGGGGGFWEYNDP